MSHGPEHEAADGEEEGGEERGGQVQRGHQAEAGGPGPVVMHLHHGVEHLE